VCANTGTSSLESQNSETDEPQNSEIDELRSWAIECNIQHNHLDKLLAILRKNLITALPHSSTTFLRTSEAEYEIVDMKDNDNVYQNGQFVYFGISTKLQEIIESEFYQDDVIRLLINVDGMPLSGSGSTSFWPILCKIYYHLDVYKPFIVCIYCGKSKPKFVEKFLNPFINEINELHANRIVIGKMTYKVQLMAFICDTPARAFLKCTKGHGGYSACERCTIPGELLRIGKSSKIIYPGVEHIIRTKQSFNTQADSEHHIGISPLLNIIPEIDLTKIFVLDHMHLFFNGVMKKLINFWMKGSLKIRLSSRQKTEISRRLLSFNIQMPVEFQRKPRAIFDYLKWKATEFRFFLLYCGPVVLKNILPQKLYDHFLLLHVACRILCSEELAVTHNSTAQKYLQKFVLLLPYLYEPQSQVMNMHNLLHVADDVINFNCSLSRISCFPFESTLGEIKRMLRTPNKPLSQICRRLYEKNTVTSKKLSIISNKILKKKVENNNVYVKNIQYGIL